MNIHIKGEFGVLWDWGLHFLNFSKIFVSAHFFYRLFLIDFNQGIRLGHCVPRPCRNLGLKQFLTHGGIWDTSEKIQTIKKMDRLRGWQGVLL